MRVLLDTHLLLWAARESRRLPAGVRALLANRSNQLHFSAANIWEVAIKSGLGKRDFQVDPRLFRRGLLKRSYQELPITGEHSVAMYNLPPIHKDPFDRILVAQAITEGITLLTTDQMVAQYPGPIQKV